MALTENWQVSSFTDRGNCVEVRQIGEAVQVRNSKFPDGPLISYTTTEWKAFLSGAREGEFDLT
jgi:Domain of unknown function (DUF397)